VKFFFKYIYILSLKFELESKFSHLSAVFSCSLHQRHNPASNRKAARASHHGEVDDDPDLEELAGRLKDTGGELSDGGISRENGVSVDHLVAT